jgi:cell division protein FtsB
MEEQIQELARVVELLRDEVEQLNTEISALNSGDNWDGKLVDALMEVARAIDPEHWSRKK